MAINLHLLRMFVAVVEHGGFSQAALTLKQRVASGFGVAIVSLAAAKDQIALGALKAVEMAGLAISRPLYRLRVKGRPLARQLPNSSACSLAQRRSREPGEQADKGRDWGA